MRYLGNLRKMRIEDKEPLSYFLKLGAREIHVNEYLGQTLTIRHTGKIYCINCATDIKKSFRSGYCFPCTQRLAECDMCVLQPVRCHYSKGTCREPAWGDINCNIPHVVYLAYSSDLKVGITRYAHIPSRWFDQGAILGLPILSAPTRHVSGLLENFAADFISDNTDWRKMLGHLNYNPEIDLLDARNLLFMQIQDKYNELKLEFGNDAVQKLDQYIVKKITYPILVDRIHSFKTLTFSDNSEISGTLIGIKGQYLIFDIGVINIRSNAGYEVEFF